MHFGPARGWVFSPLNSPPQLNMSERADPFDSSAFFCTPETARETVARFGVAIVRDVLTPEECVQMRCDMWSYLRHITQTWEMPITTCTRTWAGMRKLYPKHSMLLQQWGVGQSQLVWNVRQNPKVVSVFEKIWKTSDLLVSFDGASFHFPPEHTNVGWFRKPWYHSDQSYTRPEFGCIQGWVNAFDTRAGDATLAVLEGSHVHHAEFARTFNVTDSSDWFKFDDEKHFQFYMDKGCTERRICCPAGSLVLWDSRTIHCGVEPMRTRPRENMRCTVYVCYQPRQMCTPALLRKKQEAFNNLRTTNHYPCKPKLFPERPNTYGGEMPDITPIRPPTLTALGRRLAGF